MKLRTNKALTNLVDQIPSEMLVDVADLIVPADGDFAALSWNVAHADGIIKGIQLAQSCRLKGVHADIYVAKQEVSGGFDHLYFTGKLPDILDRLRDIVQSTKLA